MSNYEKDYCVLMSIYAGGKGAQFRQAIESMVNQSLKPKQIVVVCDGPLTEELEQSLSDMTQNWGDLLCIVRLKKNLGLGPALNAGLAQCSYEYIARMDADDIAYHDRCEKQLLWMQKNCLDLCSGAVEEFTILPNSNKNHFNPMSNDIEKHNMHTDYIRCLPTKHEDLIHYARRRNPMNHPCVMFRKSTVQKVGGYQSIPCFEDYDLWVRMILAGAKIGNCPEILVHMRAGKDMYQRRGGIQYCYHILYFFGLLKKSRFINWSVYIQNVSLRCVISLLPDNIRRVFYQKTLRKSKKKGVCVD